MAIDISNFYIQNDLKDFLYICFAMDQIQQETRDKYNLEAIVHTDGYCYAEICKAMYGLRKAGYMANIELKRALGLAGYI